MSKMIRYSSDKSSKQCRQKSDGATSMPSGSVEVVSLVERTDAVLKGLLLLLEHFGAEIEIGLQLSLQLHAYLDNSVSETVWLKRCKYVYTYPLAKFLRCELPPSPDVAFKASGGIRGWMRTRLNAFNRPNVQFWYSWFQCKRSTLPLSEDIIEQNYENHLLTLTKVDSGDEGTIRDIFRDRTFLKVIWDLRDAVTKAYQESDSFHEWMPSTNSCFEATRSMGGQQAELGRICGLNFDDLSLDDMGNWCRDAGPALYPLAPTEFFSIVYRPWVYTRKGIGSNFHQERRFKYGHEEWSQLVEASKNIDLSQPLNCTIQAVLEPNKVRIISKGNALPYYSCRPLQRALHSSMKELKPFRLIGRPFCATDMIDLQDRASLTDNWFSVDYSAATDGLSWRYSGQILKFLIEDLPPNVKEVALSVLGPHALHYPVKGGRGAIVLKGVQQNGQLMGSILSFPILCLANFGVYCLATQKRHFREEWSFEQRMNHVLINGDDMVYADDPSSWKDLIDIARKVGLEMSVGKAYVHREYANINSTSVLLPLHKEGKLRTPWQINYLNTGLFFGQHKVQGSTELASQHSKNDPSKGLVVNLNTILAGSRPGHESELLKTFLSVHKEEIKKECTVKTYRGNYFVRNLFVPIALGGMGVLPPPGWKFFLTKQELYVANGFIDKLPSCAYTSQNPLPGYPLVEKIDGEVSVPWSAPEKDKDPLRVPLKKISFGRLRALCRIGMVRYCPFKACASAVLTVRREAFQAPPLGDLDILI